ncbi:ABC transporter ATP-binding protein [Caenimonas terrae]|uniref:ABC transporter ATP-binding protein n=1 Tax=Caenimonas terrae TaxID=696074 RepID=A0ABW0N6F5_9BURK
MASDALVLDGVHAHYGRSHVLHGVSLSLRRGALLALLGRNGAGKSTTMLTIAGLIKPSGGRISAGGTAIDALAPEAIARSGVRLVPQGRRVFPSLTVDENLAVAAQMRPVPRPWTMERVFELFPHLERRRRQRAGTLSGGEQQMLAIGRALMGNPEVLLLDEPSEGLAPLLVVEVVRGIAQLKAEGLSIILVEQNFKLAMTLADDVVVLNTGAVAISGTAAQVLADPKAFTSHLSVT